MSRLSGRRILVVGGGTQPNDDPDAPVGNGRAIAVVAAREGATVAIADIDPRAATATAEMVAAEGGRPQVIEVDVADPGGCSEMVKQAHAGMEGLDGLVLNVGIGVGLGLQGTTVEKWDLVFAVNVRSNFVTMQAAFPLMPPGSAVAVISSVAALRPGSGIPSYDGSKTAQLGLARYAGAEGAPLGIRVNTVAPGLIDTPLGRRATAGRPSRASARIPLGRQGTAWEVAAAVAFLLSEDASYITGQVLAVDGGLSTLI